MPDTEKTVECEFYLIVGETGGFEVHPECSDAAEAFNDNHGDDCRRVIKVTLIVTRPMPQEVTGIVPDETPGEIKLTVSN